MAAGIATLDTLRGGTAYALLEQRGAQLQSGLEQAAADANVSVRVQRVGSMLTMFFTEDAVTDFDTAKLSDTARFGHFYRGMLERGVYLAPSQFESCFISVAHTAADVDRTVAAAADVLLGLE
jgi:glutamate-1-semialdehyde 2,1-aminomutase